MSYIVLIVATLRLAGMKTAIYKSLAHVFVGFLAGAGIYKEKTWWIVQAIILVLIEVGCVICGI